MIKKITNIIIEWGVNQDVALVLGWISVILSIFILAVIANYITKKILLTGVTRLIKKTKTDWDDALLDNKVFTRLSHIAPALVIYFTSTVFSIELQAYVQRFSTVYMILTGLLVVSGFLNAVVDIYRNFENSKQKPIKGYVQVAKIIIYVFIGIYAAGIVLDQSVLPILGGLGAMTAVILLVFKDSILGLVASIQLSGNDMVHIGDWIEMPKFKADGDVIDITLNTVKVQNWDKTISYIPAYALISDSFKNWRGMSESDGRRIKRSLSIDMNTVKFASPELLEKWEKFQVLTEYLKLKKEELDKYNKDMKVDSSQPINGRNITNLGTFRAYLVEYLKRHPQISDEMTFLIRHLQPTEKGIPIEIYIFSTDKNWINYEAIQADIFDHILAVVPEFELRVFQNPSGNDFSKLASLT